MVYVCMKKHTVLLFLLLFTMNAVISSAWVIPCFKTVQTSIQTQLVVTGKNDMPCHQMTMDVNESEPMPTSKSESHALHTHCDGLCLCAHATVSPTIHLSGMVWALPVTRSHFSIPQDDAVASLSMPPHKRPPKLLL